MVGLAAAADRVQWPPLGSLCPQLWETLFFLLAGDCVCVSVYVWQGLGWRGGGPCFSWVYQTSVFLMQEVVVCSQKQRPPGIFPFSCVPCCSKGDHMAGQQGHLQKGWKQNSTWAVGRSWSELVSYGEGDLQAQSAVFSVGCVRPLRVTASPCGTLGGAF